MALAKPMWVKHKQKICVTITSTGKKYHQYHDIPFLKLSKGALREVKRGWFREAVIEMKTPTGKKFQCTTWCDKKHVLFLHSNVIGTSKNNRAKQFVKGGQSRFEIDVPQCQIDYVDHLKAVDWNRRYSSDFSTTIKMTHYYLRTFCWMLDRVVRTLYAVVVFLEVSDIWADDWGKYRDKIAAERIFRLILGSKFSTMSWNIRYEEYGGSQEAKLDETT